MAQAVVALGGNVGDVHDTFVRAVDEMQREGMQICAVSGLYGSAPWPASEQAQSPYTNAVVRLQTPYGPLATLRRLKRIERRLGRTYTRMRNAARIIDLDLIAYGNVRMRRRRLTLPHPRAHLRAFVIVPMRCVAPQFRIGVHKLFEARSSRALPINSQSGLLWWRLAWPLPTKM